MTSANRQLDRKFQNGFPLHLACLPTVAAARRWTLKNLHLGTAAGPCHAPSAASPRHGRAAGTGPFADAGASRRTRARDAGSQDAGGLLSRAHSCWPAASDRSVCRPCSRSAPEPSAMMDMNLTRPDNATLLMLQDPTIAVALPVVYSLVALVSIPGNLFSLWVLCRHIGPQSPSVIFMINLSVTDLTLASVLPFQIYYHCNGHHWVFGELLCNAVTVAFYANMYSSILTMTCISVDRFLGVVYPLASARWRRRRYAVAACVAMWLLLLAALSPLARTDLTYAVEALGIVTCFDVLKSTMLPSVAMWAIFLFTLFIVLFLIPFVVTVACYTATILKLLRTPDPHGRGQRRRAVCLAAVVLLAFVTCFAPNNFVLLVHMVSRLFFGRSYYHVYKLTLCLSCLNNCLDPFVYYFASREFQLRLRDYLGYGRLPTDGTEARRDSLFSARTLSARSTASGHADGPEGAGRPCLKRQESLL
ncbi:P2Y purinoceptor 8 isoform X1 [Equus przewalskii]|uniref:P2Y receptor family member 8 n=2 Tax=Equus TaxID=9789 RepID=A0A9L0SC19_HORSE